MTPVAAPTIPFSPYLPDVGTPGSGAQPFVPRLPDPFSPFVPEPEPLPQPDPDKTGGCNCVTTKTKPDKGPKKPPRAQCKGGVYVQKGKGIKFTPQYIADCDTGKKIGELPKGGAKKKPITKSIGDLAGEIFNIPRSFTGGF